MYEFGDYFGLFDIARSGWEARGRFDEQGGTVSLCDGRDAGWVGWSLCTDSDSADQ